jgi:hypothetical protein
MKTSRLQTVDGGNIILNEWKLFDTYSVEGLKIHHSLPVTHTSNMSPSKSPVVGKISTPLSSPSRSTLGSSSLITDFSVVIHSNATPRSPRSTPTRSPSNPYL